MKRIAFIGWLILLPLLLNAQGGLVGAKLAGFSSGTTPATASYLYQQDFESGVNSPPSLWSVGAGAVTWNASTSPAPLLGSFSMSVAAAGSALYTHPSNLTTAYGYFLMNDATGNTTYFILQDFGSVNNLLVIDDAFFSGNHHLEITVGGVAANTVTTFALGTTLSVWWRYTAGSGANAVGELWVSSTTIKPTTGGNSYCTVTTGASTGSARVLKFVSATTAGTYDHIIYDSASIGSNP